jgi:hypothetical protein
MSFAMTQLWQTLTIISKTDMQIYSLSLSRQGTELVLCKLKGRRRVKMLAIRWQNKYSFNILRTSNRECWVKRWLCFTWKYRVKYDSALCGTFGGGLCTPHSAPYPGRLNGIFVPLSSLVGDCLQTEGVCEITWEANVYHNMVVVVFVGFCWANHDKFC